MDAESALSQNNEWPNLSVVDYKMQWPENKGVFEATLSTAIHRYSIFFQEDIQQKGNQKLIYFSQMKGKLDQQKQRQNQNQIGSTFRAFAIRDRASW